jgi:hypothetical protein
MLWAHFFAKKAEFSRNYGETCGYFREKRGKIVVKFKAYGAFRSPQGGKAIF